VINKFLKNNSIIDKCQKVVNSMLHLRHFCYLSYKLFREKLRKRWTIALLRFLYLTLSICAGIEWQDTKKERKTRICEKSQLVMASDLLAKGNSPPTCHGELTCHGEQNYSRGELRWPNLSKLTWQKPTGEESSTRHGEQITCHGEFIKFYKYKRPICSFQWGRYHIITEIITRTL